MPVASPSAKPPPVPAGGDELGLDDPPAPPPPGASAKPGAGASAKPPVPSGADELGLDDPPPPVPGASAKPASVASARPPGPPIDDELGLDDPLAPAKPAGSPAPGPSPHATASASVGVELDDDLLADGPTAPAGGATAVLAKPAAAGSPAPPPEIDTELTEAPPTAGKVFTNSVGMQLVWLQPGSFTMGAERKNDPESDPAETPPHSVTISRVIAMGIHEVTQGQFKRVMGYDRSRFQGDDLPCDTIVYEEAKLFCQRLSGAEKKRYRLPTEAEWEYACRASSASPRYSPRPLEKLAWYRANAGYTTHPVGRRAPNAWGFYDMLGNVSEWCEDVWHETYVGAPVDGSARAFAATGLLDALGVRLRVRRGGGISNYPVFCRSSFRGWAPESARPNDHIGFRVVLEK